MDTTAFSEFKTGRWVPNGRNDFAFVPNPLPPSELNNQPYWPIPLEARTKLERLSAIGSQLPDVNLLLRPLQRREALICSGL